MLALLKGSKQCFNFGGFKLIKGKYVVPESPVLQKFTLRRIYNQLTQKNLTKEEVDGLPVAEKQQAVAELDKIRSQISQEYASWKQNYYPPTRPLSEQLYVRLKVWERHFKGELPARAETAAKVTKHISENAREVEQIVEQYRKEAAREDYQRAIQGYKEKYGLPKRPMLNKFSLFVKENSVGGGKPQKEIMGEIKQKYAQLSEDELKHLQERADRINQEYQQQWVALAGKFKMDVEEFKAEVRRQLKKGKRGEAESESDSDSSSSEDKKGK